MEANTDGSPRATEISEASMPGEGRASHKHPNNEGKTGAILALKGRILASLKKRPWEPDPGAQPPAKIVKTASLSKSPASHLAEAGNLFDRVHRLQHGQCLQDAASGSRF